MGVLGEHNMTSRKLCVLAGLFASLVFMPWKSVGAAATEPLLIVVGPKFPGTDLPYASLKSAFRGQRVTVTGKVLVPINHPADSPLRVTFDKMILGLKPDAVARFWVDMRIRDQGKPPTTASTPELALRIAGALDGAITYTTKSALPAKSALKVLSVDGTAAGQPAYALQP